MQDSNDLHSMLEGDDSAPAMEPERNEPVQRETQPEPTGEPTSAAPPADANQQASDGENWTRQAALDERRKRQDAERRIAEYEKELNDLRQQRQQPQGQMPSWYENPEQAAQAMQAQFQNEMFQTRLALTETFMRQQHQDFEEVSVIFAEQAKRDPSLIQKLYSHPSPAQYAYQIGKQIQFMQDVGNDPAAYRKKLEDEIRAQIVAEQGGSQQSAPAQSVKPQVPRSLARDVSQQPRVNGKFASFDTTASLDELLG